MIFKRIVKLFAVLLLGVLLGGYFFLGDEKIGKLFSQFVTAMDKAGLPIKEPNAQPRVNQAKKVAPIPVAPLPSETIPVTPLTQKDKPTNNEMEQQGNSGDPSVTNATKTLALDIIQEAQTTITSMNGTDVKKTSVESMADKQSSNMSSGKNIAEETTEIKIKEEKNTHAISTPHPNASVIVFTSANKRVAGNALRGEISSPEGTSLPLVQEDGMVPLSFIDDMASFFVVNYWPKGTHPSAQNKDFSTVTLRWINSRYSGYFVTRDAQNIDSSATRKKVFSYVLKPVMVNALGSLYKEKFIDSLVRAGFTRFGQDTKGKQQVSTMLSFYALRAKSVASALRGYLRSSEARQKSEALITAEACVQEAYRKYNEIRFSNHDKGSISFRSAVKKYQNAIWTRDQAKMRVASVMRRSGDTRYLSEDELNFMALWLTRRDQEYYDGLSTFADVLRNLSAQMNAKAQFIDLERRSLSQ